MGPMIFTDVKLLIAMSISNSLLEFKIPFKLVLILDPALILKRIPGFKNQNIGFSLIRSTQDEANLLHTALILTT